MNNVSLARIVTFRESRLPLAKPVGLVSLLVVSMAVQGCASMMHNPFRDELAGVEAEKTPSVEAALMANVALKASDRGFERIETAVIDGTVTHGALYFESPYEETGSDDDQFCWTWEDYWQIVYWRGRFLGNALFIPFSFVDTPPWKLMASDGNTAPRSWLREEHDASSDVPVPAGSASDPS